MSASDRPVCFGPYCIVIHVYCCISMYFSAPIITKDYSIESIYFLLKSEATKLCVHGLGVRNPVINTLLKNLKIKFRKQPLLTFKVIIYNKTHLTHFILT